MTRCQLKRNIEIAKKYGAAKLNDVDAILVYHEHGAWSLIDNNGNVVDTSNNAMTFEYICD